MALPADLHTTPGEFRELLQRQQRRVEMNQHLAKQTAE
jgi:hypothetical protein